MDAPGSCSRATSDVCSTATIRYVVKSAINYHYEFDIAVTSCILPNSIIKLII